MSPGDQSSQLTVTLLLLRQGRYKVIGLSSTYLWQQVVEEKDQWTPNSKKGNKKTEMVAKQSRALLYAHDDKKLGNQECGVEILGGWSFQVVERWNWLGHGVMHTYSTIILPSPSWLLCKLLQPLTVTRQSKEFRSIAHVHTKHSTLLG